MTCCVAGRRTVSELGGLISPPDAAISKQRQARMTTGLAIPSFIDIMNAHGPIAQTGQSRRLITGRSQVRILVGPLYWAREKDTTIG
jgi:hypothetical protein